MVIARWVGLGQLCDAAPSPVKDEVLIWVDHRDDALVLLTTMYL
jgi:hypothetical protein